MTGGEAHDCLVTERLFRRVERPNTSAAQMAANSVGQIFARRRAFAARGGA